MHRSEERVSGNVRDGDFMLQTFDDYSCEETAEGVVVDNCLFESRRGSIVVPQLLLRRRSCKMQILFIFGPYLAMTAVMHGIYSENEFLHHAELLVPQFNFDCGSKWIGRLVRMHASRL